jgi:hypothetical protein
VQGETLTVWVDLDFGCKVEQEGELMGRKVNSVATSTINYYSNKVADGIIHRAHEIM